ncbi:acyl-CoA dehydrogenase family protein [Streptomyces sp. NPDC050997]|uniref:acyl-CoA dehydrogenase family protein n=1 Tax=Streptomyces sp. NPDC050997 TaxID=3155519 RepID=UPI0034178D8C
MPSPQELSVSTRAFVQERVLPVERELVVDGRPMDDALRLELQKAAKEAGVFGPMSAVEYGGLGLDMRGAALVMEAAGTSLIGPLALNCSAPDDGNIHLLAHACDEEQARRYLSPLAAGDLRSAIAMTEPAPGAGSDPSMLMTVAEETADGWVINGRKHFTTGAEGAAFTICVANTDYGATLFLVDQDNPGMKVGRRMPTLDHSNPGGHSEVEFDNCAVPNSAVLGEVGRGLDYAQARMAPSRLALCMNWLGLATRAHEMSARYIGNRTAFGAPISEHGMAQGLVADNEIDIMASRALIHSTATVLDEEGPLSSAARHAASVAKTFVAEAVWRVLDRAVQLHGGLGVCEDHFVARFLMEARAVRIYEGASEVLRWSIGRRVLRNAQK